MCSIHTCNMTHHDASQQYILSFFTYESHMHKTSWSSVNMLSPGIGTAAAD